MDDDARRESDPDAEETDPFAEESTADAGGRASADSKAERPGRALLAAARHDPYSFLVGGLVAIWAALADAWEEHRLYTYFAGALFALGILIGAGIAATGVNLLEEIAEVLGENPYASVEFTAVGIFLNNARVFVFSIVLGTITVGLFAVLVMMVNGILVGNLVAIIGADVGYGPVVALIVPHGIFELPALFAACAVAFRLIHRLGQRILGRRESFVDRAYLYRTAIFVVVMFVVLAFAAVIEVHVTGWIAETVFGIDVDAVE